MIKSGMLKIRNRTTKVATNIRRIIGKTFLCFNDFVLSIALFYRNRQCLRIIN